MSIDVKARAATPARRGDWSDRVRRAGSTTSTPEPPRIPGRRNPKWIALGIVALCLGALLSYAVYNRVGGRDLSNHDGGHGLSKRDG